MTATDPWDDVVCCWPTLSPARQRVAARLVREVCARTTEPQTCPECRVLFYPPFGRTSRFCSAFCRKRWTLDRRTRQASQYGVCGTCGSAFALVTVKEQRVLARHLPRGSAATKNGRSCDGSYRPPQG